MRRNLLCSVAAVATLSGLFVVTATPALAAPPTDTANFHPDDDTVNHESGLLSDRFDGEDSTAHLTNVSTTDTSQVEWRLCSSTTVTLDSDEELTQAEFDACTIVIGSDMSPTTPEGNPPANVDEAYEFNWNIPGTEDGATRDLVAAACTGAGRDVEDNGSPADDERTCVLDIENDVLLDDSQTVTPQTDTGEIISICTADPGGPVPGPTGDLCVRGEGGTAAEVDARFLPFEHGDNVPNEGFTFRARTSDNVDVLAIDIETADATDNPDHSGDEGGNCTRIFTGTNFNEYECEVSDVETPEDAELSLGMTSHGAGQAGLCAFQLCVLDNHYVVSNARRAESVVATFRDFDQTEAEDCADTPDKANTNNLDDADFVLFCVFDQFGQPFDTSVTFESSGPSSAGFDSFDCSAMNHDNDAAGVDEHCDGTTGSAGASLAEIANPDDWDPGEPALVGVQNVTACVDSEPNPLAAGHGCHDQPGNLTDVVDKTWESNADEVTLVYGDKSTNCRTGPTFRENQVGDEDDLLACVFDAFGNPISTTGTDDGFLEWSIGAGGDDEVDTQFVGTPQSETDADAEAVARIRAINPGSDNPTVCLRDEDTGDVIGDCAAVQKNVTGIDGGGDERADSTVTIRHRGRPHRFVGGISSPDNACESGRLVRVRRRDAGPDTLIGSDTTNANGRYRVNHNRTRRRFRYYARVNGNGSCRGDTSPNTPRTR